MTCSSNRATAILILILFGWRHNGHDNVSNHQPHDCLLNRLFRRRSKKTSKLRVTGLCAGNSPGTGEFPAQMASNAENVSIWWRHHATLQVPIWDGWGCEVSCGGHQRQRGKTTIGSALDGAVLNFTQILAYLVLTQYEQILVYLGFAHFGWLRSIFSQ